MDKYKSHLEGLAEPGELYFITDQKDLDKIETYWIKNRLRVSDILLCVDQIDHHLYEYKLVHAEIPNEKINMVTFKCVTESFVSKELKNKLLKLSEIDYNVIRNGYKVKAYGIAKNLLERI